MLCSFGTRIDTKLALPDCGGGGGREEQGEEEEGGQDDRAEEEGTEEEGWGGGARENSAVTREREQGTQVGGEMAAMAAGPSSVGYGRS